MSTSSSNSADAPSFGIEPSVSIHDRVVELANRSQDRSEFLRLLAAELRRNFCSAIVAVESALWTNPMMLVVDECLSTQIRRDALRELLAASTEMPSTCQVPSSTPNTPSVRAMRVQLTPNPDHASVLLMQPPQGEISASQTIAALKELHQYAIAVQSVTSQVPVQSLGDASAPKSPPIASDHATCTSDEPKTKEAYSRKSLRTFHLNLDLHETADRITNETRRLLKCDRVTLLIPQGSNLLTKSVSGVAVVDRRSNSIRATEKLATAATVLGQPTRLPSAVALAPQIQTPLDQYLDETNVTSTLLMPLYRPQDTDIEMTGTNEIDPFSNEGKFVGVMLLENFTGEGNEQVTPFVRTLAAEASIALNNSLEHRSVFGLHFWKLVGSTCQTLRHPLAATLVFLFAIAVIASTLITIDHQVIATGSLQPIIQRDLFATVDGTVKTLHVHDGQKVQAGDLLVTLENTQLDQRSEKLSGDIITAQKRLASIQAVRLGRDIGETNSTQMAIEQSQLASELANLRAQQQVVRQQQQELQIISPINGTVLAWQIKRRLNDRPVTRGNLLVSVADTAGPWSLDLRLDDTDAGEILDTLEQQPELNLTFAVATLPKETYAATLSEVGTAARLDERRQHVIDAVAQVQLHYDGSTFQSEQMLVGADVTAKITCGRRSVFTSWFGDVIDFAHRNILFYL